MTITIVILVLLIAVYYFYETAKSEKNNNTVLQKNKNEEKKTLEYKLHEANIDKKILGLIFRINTDILGKSKTIIHQEVICREIGINRYFNSSLGGDVEDKFFKSEIRVKTELAAYTITIFEDLEKAYQLDMNIHITNLDKIGKFLSSSKKVKFEKFMEFSDDDLFNGYLKIIHEAELDLKETIFYSRKQ